MRQLVPIDSPGSQRSYKIGDQLKQVSYVTCMNLLGVLDN